MHHRVRSCYFRFMLSKLRQTVKKIDMFSTTEFFRYKEQTEYGTLTGSCISFGIIAVIFLLVYQVLLHTVRKDKVIWSQTVTKQTTPSDVIITLGDMKFGINLFLTNLNDPNISYFDVKMEYNLFTNGAISYAKEIPLQPCRLEDWSDSEASRQVYTDNGGDWWLCPDPSEQVALGGRWTTSLQKTMSISLHPCGLLETSKTNCATDAQMAEYFTRLGGTGFLLVMINSPVIRPGELQPLTSYVEDNTFSSFNNNTGDLKNIFLDEYEIQTDSSLMPTTRLQTSAGTVLADRTNSYTVTRTSSNSSYTAIIIRKSASKVEYQRSFNKIDETVSYAGGLIGVVVGLFFLMAPYTQLSFEISLANRLFSDEEGKPLRKSFNFLKGIGYAAYSLLNCCCQCVSWPEFALLTRCSEQVQKQLDIVYLLRRLNTIERAILRDPDIAQMFRQGYQRMPFDESSQKADTLEGDPPDSSSGKVKKENDSGLARGEYSQFDLDRMQHSAIQEQLDLNQDDVGIGVAPVIIRPLQEVEQFHSAQQEGQSRLPKSRKSRRRPHSMKRNRQKAKSCQQQGPNPFTCAL